MTTDNSSAHYRNCNLCEAICGIEITVQADRRLDIRGDKDDPFSRGYICPKAVALQDIHYDKDRLRYPVRRTANGWQRIGWDEAFDEVAQNLHAFMRSMERVPRALISAIPPFITTAQCCSCRASFAACTRATGSLLHPWTNWPITCQLT